MQLFGRQRQRTVLTDNIVKSSLWDLSYCDRSTFFYKKCFDFSERTDSYEFIVRIIQIHKNNAKIETEANNLGRIEVKVFGNEAHKEQAEKLLNEIDYLYENCLDCE